MKDRNDSTTSHSHQEAEPQLEPGLLAQIRAPPTRKVTTQESLHSHSDPAGAGSQQGRVHSRGSINTMNEGTEERALCLKGQGEAARRGLRTSVGTFSHLPPSLLSPDSVSLGLSLSLGPSSLVLGPGHSAKGR